MASYVIHNLPTPIIVAETGASQYVIESVLVSETSGGAAYTLALGAGSYAFTGDAATMNIGHNLTLGAGSYSYTGSPVSFAVALSIALGAGVYHFVGTGLSFVLRRFNTGASEWLIRARRRGRR